MKIIVNGNTVTEMICEKIVKVREFGTKELVKEVSLTSEDMNLVEKIIAHVKKNKVMYARLVLMTALMIQLNINFAFAGEFASSLDTVGTQIMSMLTSFAKWGCIGMGVKSMTITLINGGDMKAAMKDGTQYWLGFLFIQFYPQLFDLFNGINFKL